MKKFASQIWTRPNFKLGICRLSFVAAVCLLILPSRSQAIQTPSSSSVDCEKDSHCRDLFAKGRKLQAAGDYAGAIASFDAAYDSHPDPRLLVFSARSRHKAGRVSEALELYLRVQPSLQNAAERAKVDSFIAEAHSDLARQSPDSPQSVSIPPLSGPPSGPPPPGLLSLPPQRDTSAMRWTTTTTTTTTGFGNGRPLYKQWWLWVVVGGVATAGIAAIIVAAATGQVQTTVTRQ